MTVPERSVALSRPPSRVASRSISRSVSRSLSRSLSRSRSLSLTHSRSCSRSNSSSLTRCSVLSICKCASLLSCVCCERLSSDSWSSPASSGHICIVNVKPPCAQNCQSQARTMWPSESAKSKRSISKVSLACVVHKVSLICALRPFHNQFAATVKAEHREKKCPQINTCSRRERPARESSERR